MFIIKIAIPAGTMLMALMTLTAQCSNKPVSTTQTTTAPATTQAALPYRRPIPSGAQQYIDQRQKMVKTQISHPWNGRLPVTDPAVLEALRTVPRHAFIPAGRQKWAYGDSPLPIGNNQTISQPYIVAYMTELLKLEPNSKVLEVGTGSGYQAAVLAHLTPHVYTIEIVEPLYKRAKRIFMEQGYTEIKCRRGDGYKGWPEAAPFDAIIVTFAADHLPPPLWEQLKLGGRIVIPLGKPRGVQYLVVISKTADGKQERETIMGVRFVPMLREE